MYTHRKRTTNFQSQKQKSNYQCNQRSYCQKEPTYSKLAENKIASLLDVLLTNIAADKYFAEIKIDDIKQK